MKRLFFLLVAFWVAFAIEKTVLAQTGAEEITAPQNPSLKEENFKEKSLSFFSNERKRDGETHSTFWLPLGSYILPGLGQYINGQSGAGFVYSGAAAVGLGTAFEAAHSVQQEFEHLGIDISDLPDNDPRFRRFLWGMKTYDLAGSLSLYHSFQTALTFEKKKGAYDFLPAEGETTDELMLAPFDFSYLKRPTTWIPLLALSAALIYYENQERAWGPVGGEDLLYSSAISYNAGVGEEALFRGWMFPMLTEAYGNAFLANGTQALLFGAAHISPGNPAPIFQTLAGFYFGWMVQRNNWSLKEAIFLHTWWDVLVFTAQAATDNKQASIYIPIYQTQF